MAEYVTLVDRFGGLNTAASPYKLPVGVASVAFDVDVSGGVVRPRYADVALAEATGAAAKSLYDWNGTIVESATEQYHFAEWGGRLFRSNYRPDSTKAVPQYTTATKYASTYWDALGIKAPASTCSAADAGSGAGPNGTYTYYVTFYNTEGDESAPSAASGAVTVTDNDISLTSIPIGYGSGTTTNGSTSVTSVANPSYFRVGMRITAPAGIPAGTYVTAVDTGTSTITLSQAATATGARELQDAQVTGRKVYRSGGTVASTLLVTTLTNVTATTYTDTSADTELGAAITTSGKDVLPACGGFDVSPAGVVAAIAPGATTGKGTVLWHTEPGKPYQSSATNYVTIPDEAARVVWALERFCIFASSGVYGLLGTDATNYELVRADGSFPSLFYWPVAMGAEVWYVSVAGICAYDGIRLRCVSEGFLDAATQAVFAPLCVAAIRKGERFFAFSSSTVLEYDPRLMGSPWMFHLAPGYIVNGQTTNCAAYFSTYNDVIVGTTSSSWRFASEANGARFSAFTYTTGFMPAGNHAPLKTFRATVVAGVGPFTTTPEAGTTAVTNTGTTDTYTGSSPAGAYVRRKAWQASGFKGRALKMTVASTGLSAANAARVVIDEMGVWIGRQAKVMP